jgi:hypothetical protein
MPKVETSVTVELPQHIAFAVSQTQGQIRYRWDPFVRSQQLLDGATVPAKGVRTLTVSRHRLKMISEYTSVRPPSQVGMKMVKGPWFFSAMGGGWSFAATSDSSCTATWRYTFTVRPSFLAPIGNRIGLWLLGRDIRRRIAGFAKGCQDPAVVAAATELATRFDTQLGKG